MLLFYIIPFFFFEIVGIIYICWQYTITFNWFLIFFSLSVYWQSLQLGCACSYTSCCPETCDHVYLFGNDYDDAKDIFGKPMRGRFPYDENGRIILEVIFFLSIKVFYTKSELRIKFGSVRLYLVMVYLVLAKILNNFLFQLTFTCLFLFFMFLIFIIAICKYFG